MDDNGKLLYAGKTESSKEGVVFIFLGIMSIIGANFIYAKMVLMAFGGLLTLLGLYLLIFKRNDEFAIYENRVVLITNGQEVSIPKEHISHIDYQTLRVRRSPVVNYYPVLVLNDQNKVRINKSFNSIANQDFKQVIESYI